MQFIGPADYMNYDELHKVVKVHSDELDALFNQY
jgi:hypothetical protein